MKNTLKEVFNALRESQKRPNYEVYDDENGLILETPSRQIAFNLLLDYREKKKPCVIYCGQEEVGRCVIIK